MAIQLPQNRLGTKQIQAIKRNVPLEQIVAVQGQNPLATGVETLGTTIGQTLQKREALRQQGLQLAKLESLSGQQPGAFQGLDPSTASTLALTNIKNNQEEKNKPYGEPFTGKDGKTYGYVFDAKKNEFTAKELPQGLPPPKQSNSGGTLVQTGLFDANGQPIVFNNKDKNPKPIIVPTNSVGGGNQTKIQLTPTSQTRSSGEFASTILPHIDTLKTLIANADAKGYIGPMGGRYQSFMSGKVGSTGDPQADYLLGQLRSTKDFLASGTMKAHVGARGGGDLLEHFLADMDTGKQSAQVLYGELDALKPFMEGYQQAGRGGLSKIEIPKSGLSPAAQALINKHK